MHQPTPSTICFNQHPWIVNHKLIIQPYYACLWGLGNFMFLLLCSPLEFDQNRITYHLLASFCPSEGKSTNPWHDPAVSECLDLPWSFRLKAGCVCTFQQEDGPVKPSGQLFVSQCAQLHFSINSLKYVFESGFFHEGSSPPQVHTFMKHPKFWTTFSTTLWRINDDFGSLPIQGLVKRYNGVKVVARLQTKAYVDRMHALSPLYLLIIGKNLNYNSQGYWLFWCKIRVIPCQFSIALSWKISIMLLKNRNRGRSKPWRFT